jgi:hypothetical protein
VLSGASGTALENPRERFRRMLQSWYVQYYIHITIGIVRKIVPSR